MAVFSEDPAIQEPFSLSPMDVINDQSESIYNNSTNITSESYDNDFTLSNDIIRLLFISITTIVVLVCLTICISAFVCICLNRRRNLKRQEHKDHLILPEQSEKITHNKLSISNPIPKNISVSIASNSKQELDKPISRSSIPKSTSLLTNGNPSIHAYYYDNFDDIPFIDESRPTSYIDITRV